MPQIILFWLLFLGIFPHPPSFPASTKVIYQKLLVVVKNVTQFLTGRKTAIPLPAPLFIFLLELLGFALKLKLTHNFVLYLFIVMGKSFLSSNLRRLEWRQIQNHSSGNCSGDNGFRNNSLEVKAELFIAALEYLQV